MTTQDPTTKTRYLRDPKNEERVVTLVTKVEDSTLSFAVAVNSPPRMRHFPEPGGRVWMTPEAGDRFERRVGSKIAFGRLACERTRKVVKFDPKTQHPFIVALTHLADGQGSVARIASSELKRLANKSALRDAIKKISEDTQPAASV